MLGSYDLTEIEKTPSQKLIVTRQRRSWAVLEHIAHSFDGVYNKNVKNAPIKHQITELYSVNCTTS